MNARVPADSRRGEGRIEGEGRYESDPAREGQYSHHHTHRILTRRGTAESKKKVRKKRSGLHSYQE